MGGAGQNECTYKRFMEQAEGACTSSAVPVPKLCAAARDCPPVCCVAGFDGHLRPVSLRAPLENDGGENDGGESDGGENDGGESDGEAEDGSDAGASVDAEAAAELDATTALLGTITGWACAYCRCRSPEETCAILQAAGQDGGP